MTSLPHNRYLLTRLQREWTLISSRRSSVERASAWRLTPRVSGSVDGRVVLPRLLTAPARRPRLAPPAPRRCGGPRARPEAARVPLRAPRHDDLAARVVLQRMRPG